MHLDSGARRHAAHRRYLDHGYAIAGHHFAKDLSCPLAQDTRLRSR
ncbi:hypothetical protein [Sciscionella marina]|nr:hypothetical protein [Sciscionella marina]